jgi:hypothetical protein
VDEGFTEVYDMGGIEDWDREILDVEAPQTHRPLSPESEDHAS